MYFGTRFKLGAEALKPALSLFFCFVLLCQQQSMS